MGSLRQLRHALRRMQTAALERELLAACVRPAICTRRADALEVAEGLFLAALLSTALWSLILFSVFHLR